MAAGCTSCIVCNDPRGEPAIPASDSQDAASGVSSLASSPRRNRSPVYRVEAPNIIPWPTVCDTPAAKVFPGTSGRRSPDIAVWSPPAFAPRTEDLEVNPSSPPHRRRRRRTPPPGRRESSAPRPGRAPRMAAATEKRTEWQAERDALRQRGTTPRSPASRPPRAPARDRGSTRRGLLEILSRGVPRSHPLLAMDAAPAAST